MRAVTCGNGMKNSLSMIGLCFTKGTLMMGLAYGLGPYKFLQEFAQDVNNIHRSIQIELRYSQEKIEFLDTWVKLENGRVYTDLYKKPSDKQLKKSSCQPSHTKTGLAFGLALRIRRIREKDEDYSRHRKELKGQLRKRGYAGKFVEIQLQRVDNQKREALLQPTHKSAKKDRVPLVMTFSKLLPDIRCILQKHSQTLYRSGRLKEVFQELPMLAYRSEKNLCDILVHSKTARLTDTGGGEDQCNCRVCQAVEKREVYDVAGNKTYSTIPNPKCTLRNVVYALLCDRCKMKVYVGETERSVKERVCEHMRDIKNQAEKPIMRHFSGHKVADMHFVVF